MTNIRKIDKEVYEIIKAEEENLIKIGSPEHKDIRNSYESALFGSVPVFESEVRVNNALNKVDNMLRRDGVESTKRWLQGVVYDIVERLKKFRLVGIYRDALRADEIDMVSVSGAELIVPLHSGLKRFGEVEFLRLNLLISALQL